MEHVRGHGLIPAHAGKTVEVVVSFSGSPAHPRSRGENLTPAPLLLISQGSSPLTRGKLEHAVDRDLVGGLIPAHAGKTS